MDMIPKILNLDPNSTLVEDADEEVSLLLFLLSTFVDIGSEHGR